MNSNNSANKRIKFMNVKIEKAKREDLNEILELQYLAYQSEAALFGTNDIPPLRQTLDEVVKEYNVGIILKMVDENGIIIGSVRAKENNDTVYIGKLMVHPDYRGNGFGTKLLSEIEHLFPNKRYELFTSTRSVDNIRLYQKSGYKIFSERIENDELTFVYMEK
jgi:ribosomal protein S18 acetylase RimI-like enzyme